MNRLERQAREAVRLAYRGARIRVSPEAYAEIRRYLIRAVHVLAEWHEGEKADHVLGEIFRLDAIHGRRENAA